MTNVIKVSMADLKVACAPDRIMTVGLGSCVGVAIYDPSKQIAGLAHVMLPSKDLSRGDTNMAKYADTAIPLLIEKMVSCGGNRRKFQAKLAGGAQMFSFQGSNPVMKIGERNVEACKLQLKRFNIPIVAEDTGGNYGRTIELDTLTGVLMVRTASKGIKKL
ncbi:chemoreceptor glutamine deamidase CheD [Caldalkalibacillus thermarum]|uniref:chemotaxis protein CheD n=1 Tax=Caldalkalibacillus thermarum TaxID=296745 RepID=UPI00166CD94E|nr:chemotaxis protein CheD [Caldalkalibacillus thermarum]GGK13593.1 chemoreceptor glutamine deamidase CheD [Caldalkalibacillus thermarum]